ncbi:MULTISPECIES: tRNA 2-selenouridine(34) synthase MnmH [unclassified Bacillus (in: firmicutes)]|uniref:tRNA 2-selenouridine(34) synthase MnmH n=1 Tax=unclassified Bacillus (in: firmicutes) TaxID=185979 RepID=UPI0008F42335|nr:MULTISPECIES: tRNA 2-selenouridine(34) synthase MnmH [unclassified Bacillus (in: firmicutes)]SFA91578.1 tRNA 2-selenouridine synthase [Bacillus sp. UNCCL13]SFQ85603.1 tRNA 2-selenouridine synthase [Bacillus sp. cl95]
MKEITVQDVLKNGEAPIFDVRSPIEFKEGSIPGAINVPIFTNEERHEIGIIYKNEGQDAAKWKAMEFVSPKIPSMLQTIKEHANPKYTPIVYCWRGGMRSKSVVTFLEFAGLSASRLIGGYKAYRQHILEEIPHILPEKAVVLHGMTGVGKTEILKMLDRIGYPILDLEHMAGHRGSIFGMIGIGEGHNQKTFDSLIYRKISELASSDFFIMEAESKRIGRVVQPEELIQRKLEGIHFHIEMPFEKRVEHIVNEYVKPFEKEDWYHSKISEGVEKISRRIRDKEFMLLLEEYLNIRNYPDMIRILLEKYYDPRYDHKRLDYNGNFYVIYAESIEEAASQIETHLKELVKTSVVK